MENKTSAKKKAMPFDVKRILSQCFKSWKLIGCCVAATLFLACAYLYLRKDKVEVLAQLMLPPESSGGALLPYMEMASALSIDGMFGGSSTDNEIAVIKSHTVFEKTARELGLNTVYMQQRYPLRWHQVYDDAQLKLTTLPSIPDTIRVKLKFDIDANSDGTFDIVCKAKRRKLADVENVELPITLETAYGPFTISKTEFFGKSPVRKFRIQYVSYNAAAYGYGELVKVYAPSKKTDFVDLSILTSDPKFGIKLLNRIIDNYNLIGNKYRDDNSTRTLDFVNKRLASLETELAHAEGEMTDFKKTHDIVEPEIDIATVVGKENTFEAQMLAIKTDLEIAAMAKEFLANPENKYALLPNVPGSGAEMSAYNELIMRRMKLVTSAKDNNPVLLRLNNEIDALRANIITSVDRTYENLSARLASLQKENSGNEARKGSVPDMQQQYVSLNRDVYMLQQLYVVLLKQREEAEMSMMKTSVSMFTVDAPYAVPEETQMGTMKVLALAVFLGLCAGMALVYFLRLPKAPLCTAKQIEDLAKAPVLGVVECTASEEGEIIQGDSRAAESLRVLRSNAMQALAPTRMKIILVTSATNAEGATFIASNLAVAMAKAGYKTALVEANMRTPGLRELFKVDKSEPTLAEIIAKGEPYTPVFEEGQPAVICAGQSKGNPADLLGSENMRKFLLALSDKSDYVVVDATHMRGYSDVFVMAEYPDLTLIVCKTGVATPDEIEYINGVYEEARLPRVACVVNAVEEQ